MATELFGDHPIPANAIRAGGIIIALSIACAAIGRYTDIGAYHLPKTPVVETLSVKFEDAADGSVIVSEAPSNRQIAVLAPGTNGFIRGTLRGLVRDRRMRSIGGDLPFVISRHDNGRLSLSDPATSRELELNGFGVTNVEAFEKLMKAAGRNA